MGETESGQISVLLGEGGQAGDDGSELGKEDVESFTKEDKVGVADLSVFAPGTCMRMPTR